MADKERNALIPLPAGGLENIGSGPKSILSAMVSDALALVRVREKSLVAARFRIGDYEFRDPDYRQILIWAKALALEPEVFIRRLEADLQNRPFDRVVVPFEVEDGSIVSLEWNFDTFPITFFEWIDGLRIMKIGFRGRAGPTKISLRLPLLECLYCSDIKLTEIDLSKVPALKELDCSHNELVEIYLSHVPALTKLKCSYNKLVALDLATVPMLTVLECRYNHFVKLDLSKIPALTKLDCMSTGLVELNLSKVSALTKLWCSYNKLVKLDLSKVPELKELVCFNNKLVELDLSKVPALTNILCNDNQLVKLDIRGLGQLKRLTCDPSVTLKKLPTQNF